MRSPGTLPRLFPAPRPGPAKSREITGGLNFLSLSGDCDLLDFRSLRSIPIVDLAEALKRVLQS